MHICTSFVELLHAKIELQQNELMISNAEEYPALLSLTCQSIENPFEKIQIIPNGPLCHLEYWRLQCGGAVVVGALFCSWTTVVT